jgi:hypothetical protein
LVKLKSSFVERKLWLLTVASKLAGQKIDCGVVITDAQHGTIEVGDTNIPQSLDVFAEISLITNISYIRRASSSFFMKHSAIRIQLAVHLHAFVYTSNSGKKQDLTPFP